MQNQNRYFKSLLKKELLGYHMYKRLAEITKDENNKKVLSEIAESELTHYQKLGEYTGLKINLNPIKRKFFLFFITLFVKILGLTFVLKFFERFEARSTDKNIAYVEEHLPEMLQFLEDEESHEQLLLSMINEERLNYVSSIVLGLNDALVELTGALAGFTLSMQNSRTIALVGLITGISASFSMAASEYLSTKAEDDNKSDAVKASIYTGLAYVFTVIFLIIPFLVISNYIISLLVTLVVAILIIAVFNYYISVVKDGNFGRQFREMAFISIGVAIISFLIGFLVNRFIGIDI